MMIYDSLKIMKYENTIIALVITMNLKTSQKTIKTIKVNPWE